MRVSFWAHVNFRSRARSRHSRGGEERRMEDLFEQPQENIQKPGPIDDDRALELTKALVTAFESPVFKEMLHQKGGWDYAKAKDWPQDPE
eukprot:9487805-Pyramimonas_sp.AAC.1